MIIYHMQRDREKKADVVVLDNGKCIVAWPTSVIIYDTEQQARDVHIKHMGGRGEKTAFLPILSSQDTEEFWRGIQDCSQDDLEGCACASVGGWEQRNAMTAPDYSKSPESYLKGYHAQAKFLYGEELIK